MSYPQRSLRGVRSLTPTQMSQWRYLLTLQRRLNLLHYLQALTAIRTAPIPFEVLEVNSELTKAAYDSQRHSFESMRSYRTKVIHAGFTRPEVAYLKERIREMTPMERGIVHFTEDLELRALIDEQRAIEVEADEVLDGLTAALPTDPHDLDQFTLNYVVLLMRACFMLFAQAVLVTIYAVYKQGPSVLSGVAPRLDL